MNSIDENQQLVNFIVRKPFFIIELKIFLRKSYRNIENALNYTDQDLNQGKDLKNN